MPPASASVRPDIAVSRWRGGKTAKDWSSADICEQAVCVVAITPPLRAIAAMASDELDWAIFQMAVESVRSLSLSFNERAVEIAARSQGTLVFDVRVYGDAQVQRVAAIRYRAERTGVVALDRQGLVTHYCMVNSTFADLMAPLENWTSLPLAMQAKIDVTVHAGLFLGALRNAGHMLGG
ncbi:hypothetical protein AB0V79_28070 [Mesorhizobium ciceri]|nr:hypothetical protein [Mesorhizobium ciceri]